MAQKRKDPLSPSQRGFVTRWGEMGRAWGLPRSAAQIHGLLLAADAPMTAEEISDALSIARSNVSTSLKELRALGVIRGASGIGDRAERFAALDDPWEAARRIAAARKAREFDPAALALREAADAADGDAAARLSAYADLSEAVGGWTEDMNRLPGGALKSILSAGAGIVDAITPKKKKKKKA
ncbi:MAG: ArsR family transcriptional regulator [Pseudomonadota bacterium]